MMGIMVPETCWASNKICNKHHLLRLVGILFPHVLNLFFFMVTKFCKCSDIVFSRFLCSKCNNDADDHNDSPQNSMMLYPGVRKLLNTDIRCGAWQQAIQIWVGWWLTAERLEGSDQGLSVMYAINPLGTFYFTLVPICTTSFNIRKIYVLHTQCTRIYVFCVDLRTNSDYFPLQH